MKTTVSYLIALFLGLLVGWVAQQFWLNSTLDKPASSSNYSLTRQQQRLFDLQQNALTSTEMLKAEASLVSQSSRFSRAVEASDLELALALFFQLDQPTLIQVQQVAELAYAQANYALLFSTLYEFRYGLDFDTERQLLDEIRLWVEKVDKVLGDKQQYDALVSLYGLLSSLEAENTFYYLRLSYWQLQAGQPFEASQSLLGASNDIELKADIETLQAAINLYETFGAHVDVPLTAVGEHYLVPVTLEGFETLQLMLDTGASMTVIKRSVIENTQPQVLKNVSELLMNTANGQTLGYRVTMTDLTIGELALESLDVALMDLPNFQYDGLLGMNVLSQFEFTIDQENTVLKLLPKKPRLSVSP